MVVGNPNGAAVPGIANVNTVAGVTAVFSVPTLLVSLLLLASLPSGNPFYCKSYCSYLPGLTAVASIPPIAAFPAVAIIPNFDRILAVACIVVLLGSFLLLVSLFLLVFHCYWRS